MKDKKICGVKIGEYGAFIALIFLVLALSAISPEFRTASNFLNLLRQASFNGLIAFGMTCVILTGGIDLSVGSILALASALMGSFIVGGMNPTVGIVVACLIGTGLGAINGLIVTMGRVAPFIATLATMTVFRGLTLVYTNGNPISGLTEDQAFLDFGQGYFLGIPVPAVVMLIMFAILHFILTKTPLGRKIYAVGGNEKVSFIAGIKIERIKIFCYSVTGMLCGLAGAILTSRLNSAQPTAGTGYELDAIAAVVLGGTSLSGGKGRIVGTLIGAFQAFWIAYVRIPPFIVTLAGMLAFRGLSNVILNATSISLAEEKGFMKAFGGGSDCYIPDVFGIKGFSDYCYCCCFFFNGICI